MIGQIVSHYRITEKLGEGGMGVVYKARDEQLGRAVAIKCLPAHLMSDETRRARLLNEARTVSALNHPNIVIIHDLLRDPTGDYMVMEYVEGRTLDRLVPRGGMPIPEMLALADQIADALAAAHGASIIHRDLKPGNIMVNAAGRVKVLDFGLAKLTETQALSDHTLTAAPPSQDGAIVGTISYMSPEQAAGRPVDARSDIFSFGLILYEMLTGQRAFQAQTAVETLAAILREEPKPISEICKDIPLEIERLVRRCLRKDPAKRWQTMLDLRLTIEELRADSDSGRLTKTLPPAKTKPSRRWPIAAAIAAGAIVITAIGIGVTRARAPIQTAIYAPVPLTSDPGFESQPAFSPDGNQVAYAWSTEGEQNTDIYVKLIGAGTPLRLTTNPAEDDGPAWSPDGKWIAFNRNAGPGERHLMVIPALGGPERRIAIFPNPQLPAWTPDGQFLVTQRCDDGKCRILLQPFEGGEARTIADTGSERTYFPSLSPDGRYLAFHRSHQNRSQSIWVMPLNKDYSASGPPKEITDRRTNKNPVWSSDGASILYTRGDPGKLYRISREGGTPEHLAWADIGVQYPAISAKANRLAFSRRQREYNIHALSLDESGRAVGLPKPAFDSTRSEFVPLFSPDGSKVAFQSDRSGDHEIWTCNTDGSNCSQITSFGQFAGSPSWSPDSQWLAFDASLDGIGAIHIIPSSGGKARQLTKRGSVPRWSHDGKWIYFGNGKIYRVSRDGGEPVQVTDSAGSSSLESPDGKYLYYAGVVSEKIPLRRIRLADRVEEEVIPVIAGRNFALTAKGIWFMTPRTASTPYSEIRFLDLQTKAVRTVARTDKPLYAGFDISPDGRQILFAQTDRDGSDLMLVEGFH